MSCVVAGMPIAIARVVSVRASLVAAVAASVAIALIVPRGTRPPIQRLVDPRPLPVPAVAAPVAPTIREPARPPERPECILPAPPPYEVDATLISIGRYSPCSPPDTTAVTLRFRAPDRVIRVHIDLPCRAQREAYARGGRYHLALWPDDEDERGRVRTWEAASIVRLDRR